MSIPRTSRVRRPVTYFCQLLVVSTVFYFPVITYQLRLTITDTTQFWFMLQKKTEKINALTDNNKVYVLNYNYTVDNLE